MTARPSEKSESGGGRAHRGPTSESCDSSGCEKHRRRKRLSSSSSSTPCAAAASCSGSAAPANARGSANSPLLHASGLGGATSGSVCCNIRDKVLRALCTHSGSTWCRSAAAARAPRTHPAQHTRNEVPRRRKQDATAAVTDRRQRQVAVTSVSSRSRAPRAGPSSAAPRGRTRRWAARSSASGRSAPRRMRRRPASCPGTAAGCEQSADPTRRCPGLSAATLCVRLPAAGKS